MISFSLSRHCRMVFGAALAFAVLTNAAFANDFQLVEDKDHLDVKYGDRLVARYMHAHDTSTPEKLHETYKPYLHIMDAAGKAPITKGPGGQFTHHRGIFFGYSKLKHNGQLFDLWHMKGVEQVHQKFVDNKAGSDGAQFTSVIHWNNKAGDPILVEHRTFTFLPTKDQQLAHIQFKSILKSPSGEVTLNGDPEHAGVQYRPANEVDRKAAIYYFPGKDTDPRKNRDLPWVGQTYTLKDASYSVVMFNHPENQKETIYSAYRDYGRFGAFPVGTVTPEKPFQLNYEWIIATGEMLSVEAINKNYHAAFGQKLESTDVTVRPVKSK